MLREIASTRLRNLTFTFFDIVCSDFIRDFIRFVGKLNKSRILITTLTHREDDEYRDELREAKGDAELEGCKCGDHGCPALPDEVGHAADVDVPRGEGGGDGGLGHGEGDAGVGRLQGPAVVAAVAAHYDLPPLT